MGYVVYIDTYFILNMGIDYLLLRLFGSLFRKKKCRWRRLCASLFGGTGAVLRLFHVPLPMLLLAFLMLVIAFPGLKKVETIKMTVYFYILNIIVGGCIFFLREQGLVIGHVWQLLLAVFVFCLGIEKGAEYFFKQSRILKNLYPVELRSGDVSITGIALLDTGNGLYDPFFHRPVMIGEYRELEKIYETVAAEKVIWIPYHSLGRKNGLIPAVKIDELRIQKEGEAISQKDVLVAVAKETLSAKNQYQFILHEDHMRA